MSKSKVKNQKLEEEEKETQACSIVTHFLLAKKQRAKQNKQN